MTVVMDTPSTQAPKPVGGQVTMDNGSGISMDAAPKPSFTMPPNLLPNYKPLVDKYSKQFGIKSEQLQTLIDIENAGGRDLGTSGTGNSGMGQFRPNSPEAKQYGVDVNNPESGIRGAAHYFSDLLKRFHGNDVLAAQAYNMGPTALADALKSGKALPQETLDYAEKWTRKMDQIATQEQKVQGPENDATKHAVQQPDQPNPHQDDHESISNKLEQQFAALDSAARSSYKKTYHAANEALVGAYHALRWSQEHPADAFFDMLGGLERGVSTPVAEIAKNTDLVQQQDKQNTRPGNLLNVGGIDRDLLKQGGGIGGPHLLTPQQIATGNELARGAIKTAYDYLVHPETLGKILQNMGDPKQSDALVDVIQQHQANVLGLPPPSQWSKHEQVLSKLAWQIGMDPLSHGLGGSEMLAAYKGLTSTLELAKDAVVGSAPAQAAAHALAAIPHTYEFGHALNSVVKVFHGNLYTWMGNMDKAR